MKKISVISGGTGGLGLEIAAVLSEMGSNILIIGRNREKMDSALIRLGSNKDKGFAEGLICNIGNENDIKIIENYITDKQLTVEYLFNNAGKGMFAGAETSDSAMIDSVFEANIKGMILLTSSILRITPEEQELNIINIMSTSALFGRAEESIYCAAKWGARGYTEALRTELKGKKRNIIAVYPGGMNTGFWNMPGHNRDTSSYMDPAEVARKIVDAVSVTNGLFVTDITINRKK
ncbi:MAG TPA: SDR family NAD(P)-dependent oxidoreductase [Bacteroidales bacterium]|nr:SDR family NAD(P)-dependent oxidoreductase [Bacteroidales bacterium]